MHKNYHRYNIVIKLFILFKKKPNLYICFKKKPNFFKKKQNRESCMVSWRESL